MRKKKSTTKKTRKAWTNEKRSLRHTKNELQNSKKPLREWLKGWKTKNSAQWVQQTRPRTMASGWEDTQKPILADKKLKGDFYYGSTTW